MRCVRRSELRLHRVLHMYGRCRISIDFLPARASPMLDIERLSKAIL